MMRSAITRNHRAAQRYNAASRTACQLLTLLTLHSASGQQLQQPMCVLRAVCSTVCM
jgi:hypothetical protein